MSKVLVTGAGGFIGSHLTELLLREGIEVKAFVHYNALGTWGWIDTFPKELKDSIEVFAGDIRDPHGVREAMKGCEAVFHLAALIAIPFSYHSPDSYVDTNVKGTLNVLQAARDLGGIRVLVTSTSEVYGTAKYVPSKKIPDVIFGGKTGTAEKFNQKTGEYDYNSQVASFIGLAPVENSRYVCMVLVDDPNADKGHGHAGGVTAGPIFRKIMEGIYYHPELSPLTHKLARVSGKNGCDVDFMGLSVAAAKKIASDRNCPVNFVGEGKRVVSQRSDVQDTFGLELMLGETVASRMPNLVGLSLKEALEVVITIAAKP